MKQDFTVSTVKITASIIKLAMFLFNSFIYEPGHAFDSGNAKASKNRCNSALTKFIEVDQESN